MSHAGKVAVIGLDGVPFSLLNDLFEAGLMPRLAEVAEAGSFLQMESVLPAVSSVAWTSFMTGCNPGEHGIFGFTDLKPNEISLRLPSYDDIRRPAIWQTARSQASIVVNLPFTYPARPLNGVLVSGFVAPILERSVYPESLIPWLKSKKYRTDVDAMRGREDRSFLIRDLFDTLNLHEEIMISLLKSQPWDLFIGVVTGTDRLHHFLFDAYADETHPQHRDFLDYYRRVDICVGRLLDALGKVSRLIVLSDHGFTRLKTQVYLNSILKSLGYLFFSRAAPRSPEDIDAASLAFAMDPNRIYLNSKERFRKGRLAVSEMDEVRAKLKAALENLRLADVGIEQNERTGPSPDEALFAEVRTKEKVYHGDCLHFAPDLVVIPRPGYDLKATLSVAAFTKKDIFTGMHTHDDAFLIVNSPALSEALPKPKITDVAGLVNEALGRADL
ncbi:MAG: alkaline phosphatase family protein [Desulfomonilaceae bacterium]